MAETSDTATTTEWTYNWGIQGVRLGWWSRLVYASLVLVGKRRSYPICICAFGRGDGDQPDQ